MLVVRTAAVNRRADRLIANRAAHVVVLESRREAWYERGHALNRFPAWKGFQDVPCYHPLLHDVLDVHNRTLARYRDRLLEAADFQLGIDGRRKVARELDAFPPYRVTATATAVATCRNVGSMSSPPVLVETVRRPGP